MTRRDLADPGALLLCLVGRGRLVRNSKSTTLYTNAGTYEVNDVSAPWVGAGLGFAGFTTTGAGEYFIGFKVAAADTRYRAPGLTDVTAGRTAVPEPSLGLLLPAGIVPLGIMYRRRRRSQARRLREQHVMQQGRPSHEAWPR